MFGHQTMCCKECLLVSPIYKPFTLLRPNHITGVTSHPFTSDLGRAWVSCEECARTAAGVCGPFRLGCLPPTHPQQPGSAASAIGGESLFGQRLRPRARDTRTRREGRGTNHEGHVIGMLVSRWVAVFHDLCDLAATSLQLLSAQ